VAATRMARQDVRRAEGADMRSTVGPLT
jgi:hypothetical protein